MSVADELLDAAIDAARQARTTLAEAANRLQAEGMPPAVTELGGEVTRAVGGLYAVEARDADTVRRSLQDAMAHLRRVLTALQQLPSPPSAVQQVTPMVARTLATLHPTCSELERQLGDTGRPPPPAEQDAPEPTIPLAKLNRNTPKAEPSLEARPKPKPTLELVADDEPTPAGPASGRAEDERRSAPRATLEVGIGFQSDSNFYTGFSGDVSDGGVFVATVDVLEVGTELLVSFWIPDGTQLTTRGRVAWIRDPQGLDPDLQPGMGVRFLELTDEQRRAIERFVRARDPLFYAD